MHGSALAPKPCKSCKPWQRGRHLPAAEQPVPPSPRRPGHFPHVSQARVSCRENRGGPESCLEEKPNPHSPHVITPHPKTKSYGSGTVSPISVPVLRLASRKKKDLERHTPKPQTNQGWRDRAGIWIFSAMCSFHKNMFSGLCVCFLKRMAVSKLKRSPTGGRLSTLRVTLLGNQAVDPTCKAQVTQGSNVLHFPFRGWLRRL